jgi:hypothetical protein
MNTGVYRITHLRKGDAYVGASVDLADRRRTHFNTLRNGTHEYPKVQACFTPFDPADFVFDILEVCSFGVLGERESEWIHRLKPLLNAQPNRPPRRWANAGHPGRRIRLKYNLTPDPDGIDRLIELGKARPFPETNLSRLVDQAIMEYVERHAKRKGAK